SRDVAYNIRLGDRSIDDARVVEAARRVGADAMIRRLPHGYAQPLGERGASLSVGGRQLLSFARALAFDPLVLVLDEATSSVDSALEARTEQALETLMRGRTSIVIAHRLSTVQNADRILVLHHGELREQGTHAELLERGGLYARLYELQFVRARPGLPRAASGGGATWLRNCPFSVNRPGYGCVHAPHDRPADPRDRSVGHRQRVRQPGSGRQKGHLGPCNRAVSCGRGPGLAGTEPAAEGGAMSERILIVDDDPNSREIVQTFLESRGYHVETAEDGQAALARLEELKPSLVLLDVMMPGMDGWEVARVIKNHPDFGSTRVVMLTARS